MKTKFISSVVEEQEKMKLTRQRRIERFQARKIRMKAYFKKVLKAKKPKLQTQKTKNDLLDNPRLQICEEHERPKITNRSRIERFHARKQRMEMQMEKALVAENNAEQTHEEECKTDVEEPPQEDQAPKESPMWNNTYFYSYQDVDRMSIADNLRKIAKSHSNGFFYQKEEQPDIVGQFEMSFWNRK